jgi:hypothetical protein
MYIKKCIECNCSVNVHVSIDDVVSFFEDVPENLQVDKAIEMIGEIPKLFHSIPTDALEKMSDKQYNIILKYLGKAKSRIIAIKKGKKQLCMSS